MTIAVWWEWHCIFLNDLTFCHVQISVVLCYFRAGVGVLSQLICSYIKNWWTMYNGKLNIFSKYFQTSLVEGCRLSVRMSTGDDYRECFLIELSNFTYYNNWWCIEIMWYLFNFGRNGRNSQRQGIDGRQL